MADDFLVQQLRAPIEEKRKMAPSDYFADLVRRGVIDEQGRVLLRMRPPRARKSRKKKPPEA